jgi:hypothetical protein
MKQITTNQAKELIKASEGKLFSVIFTKKDGQKRLLTGRTGVKKGVKGVGMAYNPEERGLLTVYDMQKLGFRLINIDTIEALKINKVEYVVSNEIMDKSVFTKTVELFKLIFTGRL